GCRPLARAGRAGGLGNRVVRRGRQVAIALPHRFDTRSVWRTIAKGAFAFDAAIVACVVVALGLGRWPAVVGLSVVAAMALLFTRLLVRSQTGSAGILSADGVVIEPNVLLGIVLPGPKGTYSLDRFAAVRVEFHMGPVDPGVQGGPHELVW